MKLLGITDETDTCDLCGKTNLKRVIVLETEDGGEVRYGSDCAAHALMGKKSATNNRIILDRARAIQFLRDLLAQGLTPQEACARFNRHSLFGGYGAHVCGQKVRQLWVGDFFCLPL